MPYRHRRAALALARCGLSVLALAGALPQLAHAASAEPAAAAADTAPATSSAEITVTATRREERAKDVPVAVTSISGEKLDVLNSSGLDIRFLSSRTPSLQIESSFGRTFPRFYIRGLGNTDYDPNAPQPVAVVYDDVALENPMLKSFPVFDLASVQVLRGPQGTLFGSNTPAGVVKLDSAKPDPNKLGGYGSVSWGTYNTVNAEAAINLPLGGGFAFRQSGILQHRDNWVTNTAYGQPGVVANAKLEGYTDVAERSQLGFTSSDDATHAILSVQYRHLDGTPRVFRAGIFQQGSNNFVAGFDPSKVSLDGYTSQSLTQWGWNLRLDHHFEGLGTVYSITSYQHARVESSGDIDGGATYAYPTTGLGVGLYQDSTGGTTRPTEYTQELRFVSEDMKGLRLQGGAYFFHQDLKYSELEYDGNSGYTNRENDLDQDIEHLDKVENLGLYASGEYKIDKLTLRAGVRYSYDHKDDRISGWSAGLSDIYDSGNTITVPSGTYAVMTPQRLEVSGSYVSWDASATYEATKNVNVYFRAGTGYQGPAIQDRVTFGSIQNSAPKQTTFSIEGGLKGSLFNHKLGFAVDGYWNDTRNFQLTAVGGATNSAELLSAKRVLGHGAEVEFDTRPIPGLTITASGSYNFTKIKDPGLAVSYCGDGCTVTNPTGVVNGTSVAYINGNPLPQAPQWVGNITARYEIPVRNDAKVFFMTDWATRSSINYFLYEAKEFKGRSLTEGGIKVGFQTANGLEVAFYGRNILNQIRAISAIDFNNLTGMINDPRIWGGSVRKTF